MSTGSLTWLRRLFLKDKGLKLLSLALAVLAWYAIRGTVGSSGAGFSIPTMNLGAATRKLVDVPVSAMVRPDPAVSVGLSPATVNVILTGGSSELQKLTRADIRVMVDCGGLRPSTNHDLPVLVDVPRRIDVTAVAQPPTVRVVLSPAR